MNRTLVITLAAVLCLVAVGGAYAHPSGGKPPGKGPVGKGPVGKAPGKGPVGKAPGKGHGGKHHGPKTGGKHHGPGVVVKPLSPVVVAPGSGDVVVNVPPPASDATPAGASAPPPASDATPASASASSSSAVPPPASDTTQASDGSVSAGEESAPPVQRVKYLRVANRTGQDLRVYVQAGDDEGPSVRYLPAGRAGYVTVAGERLTASEVRVWAKSDTSAWTDYKEEPLTLVPAPYRATEIATYTHVFE
jgi:hypothetical protein